MNHRDIGRQVTPFILAIQTKRTDLATGIVADTSLNNGGCSETGTKM